MGRRCCCVQPGCEIGSDDFNRADSEVNEIGPKWEALSGEWRIDDNKLVCDEPGVLATTICHPAVYPLGSIWTRILIFVEYDEELEGFPIHKIRFGDPTEIEKREVWFMPTSTGGDPTEADQMTIRVWVDGEFHECVENDSYEDNVEVHICYAPGLHLFAQSFAGPATVAVEQCIDDTGEKCYEVNEKNVGNISFLEGIFDQVEFEVHWIENHDCKWCGCFCTSQNSGGLTYRCLPDKLILSLTELEDCPLIEGDYEMHLARFNVIWGGGSDPGVPLPYCQRQSWLSEIISCSFGAFRLGLQCGEHTTPGIVTWTLYIFEHLVGYDQSVIRFDTEDGADTGFISPAKSSSSCDPLELHFARIGTHGFEEPAYCCTDELLDKFSWFQAIITEPPDP
jgi:hypothetical protein